MANGVRFGAKPKLNPYQREQARRMRPDGQSQRAVARLLGVDHQSNSRSAPEAGGAFILLGNPQRLHPLNNAKTGRQRSCWSLSALACITNRWACERSASEGQVANATW